MAKPAVRVLVWGGGLLVGAATLACTLLAWQWVRGLCGPTYACVTLERATQFAPDAPTIVEAADGTEVARFGVAYRRVVGLRELPPFVPAAFLAIEDARFYQHAGVDWQRVGGAVAANVRARGVAQGFSTITMQLARNLWPDVLPARDRTIARKAREVLVAWDLERTLTKDQILYEYLNTIYLGAGAYGVAAAADAYFGVAPNELTLAEAALLAALPQAPGSLNPRKRPTQARERANVVLRRMAELGWITGAEERAARAMAWRLVPERSALGMQVEASAAAYFVEAVRRQAQALLGDQLFRGGYRIRTTLDLPLQMRAESLATDAVARIQAMRVTARMDTSLAPQAAILLGRHGDGAVLAHVGGVHTEGQGFDRATQARRQVGSTFKPIVFAAAVRAGFGPETMVSNAPLVVSLEDGTRWEPENFDGTDTTSRASMREVLWRSLNRPTVRLGQLVGGAAVRDMAMDLGWRGEALHGYPAEWLGAAAIAPADLAGLMAAFAREDGKAVEWRWMASITDRWGRVVWSPPPAARAVTGVAPEVQGTMHTLLEGAARYGTGSGAWREGGYHGLLAGKTGTTSGNVDAWFVGYTPTFAAVAWLGMDRPTKIAPTVRATGGALAAPLVGALLAGTSDSAGATPWPVRPARVRVTQDSLPGNTVMPSPDSSRTILAPADTATGWCVRERTPADTGAVVTLVVPCPRRVGTQ